MVKNAVALLGEVIRHELGEHAFDQIESVRREMAALRGRSSREAERSLRRLIERFKKMRPVERDGFAHSYILMLELMNACENAYRTHRLRARTRQKIEKAPEAIIHVMTAHPTEARSPENIAIFNSIQRVLTDALSTGFEAEQLRLRHQLELAWRLSSARARKPRVIDEAEHIYSIILKSETLESLFRLEREVAPVFLRTWVGGDKDGHPGVDHVVMTRSLQTARDSLLLFCRRKLALVRRDARLIRAERLARRISEAEELLRSLRQIRAGDGGRVKKFRQKIGSLFQTYSNVVGVPHPGLIELKQLVHGFPGMVVPLELRESSDLLESARESRAIRGMLASLRRISRGGSVKWYARGFIVSMTRNVDDIRNAFRICRSELGNLSLPVVPLFEQRHALISAPRIVGEILKDREIRQVIAESWENSMEFMLGYSDSAKEIGVLASRIVIGDAIRRLDRLCRKEKITPVFFHGSGGSVSRGGGSIEEQTAWWPESALKRYKVTIQGEMIERLFSSPEIHEGQIEKIAARCGRSPRRSKPISDSVRAFSEKVRERYESRVHSEEFLEVVQRATAYPYLSTLRMGSRPTKRGKVGSVLSLRAIPWVLCWTQTRVLFPAWWGAGGAWSESTPSERAALRRGFKRDELFRSFVKLLGFTLAKVELPVWKIYLERSALDPAVAQRTYRDFETEFRLSVKFVREITGERELIWFRPWLATSIRLRSPMIHPLNMLQILALEERSPALIRETVTGVASGMLTTG